MNSIDVVIPCYNYGRFLTQCTDSVLSQRDVEVRVLIIDDASGDESAVTAQVLAARDSRVSVRHHEVNRGNIETYNEGIDWIAGEYFLLLSADDWLLPGALSRAVSVLNSHPEVALTCGKAIVADLTHQNPIIPETPGINTYHILSGQAFVERACSNPASPHVCTPTAIVRTSVQKAIGGYNKSLRHAGDLEMWLRFACRGSVALLDSYQAVYRKHESNMHYSYDKIANLSQHLLAFDSALSSDGHRLDNLDKLKRRYRNAISAKAARFAGGALFRGDLDLCRESALFAINVNTHSKRFGVDSN
jgi:glycosyltransferase involved in cell wall biosynthesis